MLAVVKQDSCLTLLETGILNLTKPILTLSNDPASAAPPASLNWPANRFSPFIIQSKLREAQHPVTQALPGCELTTLIFRMNLIDSSFPSGPWGAGKRNSWRFIVDPAVRRVKASKRI